MKSTKKLTALLGLTLMSITTANQQARADASPADTHMDWWKDARFGMFIHWGLYAVPAGRWDKGKIDGSYSGGLGEWLMHDAKIPVADYAKFADQFNPVKFDADAWVATAKAAGMKYIVITAKHHDGFAMFRTKVSPFNIVDATPFKRDPVAELAAACKKQDIKFGVYYSQSQDWHHPGGHEAGGSWDPAQQGDFDKYLHDISQPQVKELMSNYGPISVIWWDTQFEMTKERALPFAELLKLQPSIVSNDRLGSDVRADYATPEQRIPANGYGGRPWETCMTINNTWGYKVDDNHFKPTAKLLQNLIDIASKGGNYLLNVGPTAEGIIPDSEVSRLKDMGDWLKTNGEAIYGTTASPFRKQLPFGRATQKGNKLYLSIFDWPSDHKLWLPLSTKVVKAYLLTAADKALQISDIKGGVQIELPGDAPDPIASVVALDLMNEAKTFIPAIRPSTDGSIDLLANEATIDGQTAQVEIKNGTANIGYWTDEKDFVHWNCEDVPARKYNVEIRYACDPGSAGTNFEIIAGEKKLDSRVESTESWDKFKTMQPGELEVVKSGPVVIEVKALGKPHGGVMNLRSLRFIPQ